MQVMQLAFMAFLLAALTAAFSKGNRAERAGASAIFAASIVTPMFEFDLFSQIEVGIFVIDAILLITLILFQAIYNRRWLSFAICCQLLTVLTHAARWFFGPLNGDIYSHVLVFWSYPVVASLLYGSLIEPQSVVTGAAKLRDPGSGPSAAHGTRAIITSKEFDASGDDHLLLVRLLNLHGVGPDSARAATQLLEKFGGLGNLIGATPQKIRSLGFDSKIIHAISLFRQLMKSSLRRRLETRRLLNEHSVICDYLHSEMAHLDIEQFRILHLNSRYRLIQDLVHSEGNMTQSAVFPNQIVKSAIELGTVHVIIAHNHPGGDPTPSRHDVMITKSLIDALRSVDIKVIDHIVIAFSGHYSFRDRGLI